jgi:hypothetical protein
MEKQKTANLPLADFLDNYEAIQASPDLPEQPPAATAIDE